MSRVAVITNKPAWDYMRSEIESAARALGLAIVRAEVDRPEAYAEGFAAAVRERADTMFSAGHLEFQHRRRLIDFAATRRLPAVYSSRESVEAGGLMAYSADVRELYRRAAGYVDRIFKGARPGDLPVEQPTRFELIINVKESTT